MIDKLLTAVGILVNKGCKLNLWDRSSPEGRTTKVVDEFSIGDGEFSIVSQRISLLDGVSYLTCVNGVVVYNIDDSDFFKCISNLYEDIESSKLEALNKKSEEAVDNFIANNS